MNSYEVKVWKTEERSAKGGEVDYKGFYDADTAAEAAKKLVEDKQVSGKFYVEVRLKGIDVDCWAFTDRSHKLMS